MIVVNFLFGLITIFVLPACVWMGVAVLGLLIYNKIRGYKSFSECMNAPDSEISALIVVWPVVLAIAFVCVTVIYAVGSSVTEYLF